MQINRGLYNADLALVQWWNKVSFSKFLNNSSGFHVPASPKKLQWCDYLVTKFFVLSLSLGAIPGIVRWCRVGEGLLDPIILLHIN